MEINNSYMQTSVGFESAASIQAPSFAHELEQLMSDFVEAVKVDQLMDMAFANALIAASGDDKNKKEEANEMLKMIIISTLFGDKAQTMESVDQMASTIAQMLTSGQTGMMSQAISMVQGGTYGSMGTVSVASPAGMSVSVSA